MHFSESVLHFAIKNIKRKKMREKRKKKRDKKKKKKSEEIRLKNSHVQNSIKFIRYIEEYSSVLIKVIYSSKCNFKS